MHIVNESETKLVLLAKAGNEQAWDALFSRFQLQLYSYAYQCLQDEHATLDVVQETFISAIRNIHTLRSEHKFGSWLFCIAHQKSINHLRKHRKFELHDELDDENIADSSPLPEAELIEFESAEILHEAMDSLPLEQRTAITLFYIEEFSLEEIASIMRSPLGTIKSRLHAARRQLRQKLLPIGRS